MGKWASHIGLIRPIAGRGVKSVAEPVLGEDISRDAPVFNLGAQGLDEHAQGLDRRCGRPPKYLAQIVVAQQLLWMLAEIG